MQIKITVLTLGALLFALCFPAQAQQPKKVPRTAYVTAASFSAMEYRIEAFRQGLRELGYVEGKNIIIQLREAEGKLDRLPTLMAELVREGRYHRRGWCGSYSSGQGSNQDDSH